MSAFPWQNMYIKLLLEILTLKLATNELYDDVLKI